MSEKLNALIPAGLLLLIGLFVFFQFENPLAWGIVPMLIGAAWMLGSPERLLAGYWLWAVVAEYAYQISARSMVRFGDEAILGLVGIALVFDQALRRRRFPDLRLMFHGFWVLIVLFVLSFLVNRGSGLAAGVTAVQYYRPFVLGYTAYVFLKPDRLRGVVWLFMATLLFQLLVNTCWLVGVPFLPNPGLYGDVDWAVGTMGSGLFVGYTACIGIVLCLSLLWVFRQARYLGLAALLFVSFVFTNTMHAYVFLGLMVLMLFQLPAKKPIAQIAVALGVTAVLASVAILLTALMPNLLSLEQYVNRGRELLEGRKLDSYVRHLTDLPWDVPLFLVGAGPAQLGCAMTDERAYLPAKYHGWGYEYQERLEQAGGSILSHTRTGFLSIWGDFGPIAFLIYWGAHIYVMVRVIRALRAGRYVNPWQRAFALTLPPVMGFYLLVAYMADLVHIAMWGPLPWILAGTVWTPQTEEAWETAPELPVTAPLPLKSASIP